MFHHKKALSRFILCATLVAASHAMAGEKKAVPWHQSLSLSGGGYWRRRIPIRIHNRMARPVSGAPVVLAIGTGEGRAAMAGAEAASVRVCDKAGLEYLFRIEGPGGALITRGPIPPGSRLILSADCNAKSSADLFLYFDNPRAWEVADMLALSLGIRNGGVERGAGGTPDAWRHDEGDAAHKALWCDELPHGGAKCLKTTVAAGAEPTWIATRQRAIFVQGGAAYRMRAWVKADKVKGSAGWYIHVGNRRKSMMISPMLMGGGGSYGWKQVEAEFTAPVDATQASLGTVLRGTGTAWFDDATLLCLSPLLLSARASSPERLTFQTIGAAPRPWPGRSGKGKPAWRCRVPLAVLNAETSPQKNVMICADLSGMLVRIYRSRKPGACQVIGPSGIVPHVMVGQKLLFPCDLPKKSLQTFYVYFAEAPSGADPPAASSLKDLVSSPSNRVVNPGFESGDQWPDHWTRSGAPDAAFQRVRGGVEGKHCARFNIAPDAKKAWAGWHQNVTVLPRKTYLFAGWFRCDNVTGGDVRFHVHYKNPRGGFCRTKQFGATSGSHAGTQGWTQLSGLFTMPDDIGTFNLHLTMQAHGTLWHDAMVVAEVHPVLPGDLEVRPPQNPSSLSVWPVNAIVKVFQEDMPPAKQPAARIAMARNETEPLQLAVRSTQGIKQVTCRVQPPVNSAGVRLSDASVAVVGYVPVDCKTNYYRTDGPEWIRKTPASEGACDGWAGLWPDPLIPRNTFDLQAGKTQPIWVTVKSPKLAAPGDYRGRVELVAGKKVLVSTPFTVHVWPFNLPDKSRIAAIYDFRMGKAWQAEGRDENQSRRGFLSFMAEHRVSADRIGPDPLIRYDHKSGKVVTDFSAYDRSADYYFNTLNMPHTYAPWMFYCFGWGHPPKPICGEAPYEGDYPYEGMDRRKLRPAYKRVYQACLKAYWNHMKAKGWHRRCVLYISDEPHYYSSQAIVDQMIALCDMIHEAVPAMPIYSSTWDYVPAWKDALDIWGIGHYGKVTPRQMADILADGKRIWFTTDGQMCTDTPFCAVERLLPHYCFHHGAEAYEFWGISWLTHDPWRFGWHRFIHQSSSPGDSFWVRYPNGDGFLAYPGAHVGAAGPVPSIRLAQAREGVEDGEYLFLLKSLLARVVTDDKNGTADRAVRMGRNVLAAAARLAEIPNAGGRYSTRILQDPDKVFEWRKQMARAIAALLKLKKGA